jgi:putative ABC transport system permease protein
MFRNYVKTAFRNLLKNKIFSLLNIFGLALGIAACFFIFQYIHFEKSYDRFNSNIEDLYRVTLKFTGSLSNVGQTAANHPAVGPAMKADFPEVKDFTRVVSISLFGNAVSLTYTPQNGVPKSYNEDKIFVADPSFFRVFTYKLLSGNKETCLSERNSAVLSRSQAIKYFGKEDPLGKTLMLNGNLPLKVSGIVEDVPDNSHIKFDILVSFVTLGKNWGYDNWLFPEFYNYVVLTPGADPKKVEAKFPGFIQKYLGAKMKELNYGAELSLQPVGDIHLKSNLLKEAESNGSEREVTFLSIIGLFILVIAWINYINLSTARSMERAKEVGLRKVVGAGKSQLITQFLFESVIINILALILAAAIVLSTMPFFRDFIGKDILTGFYSTGLGSEPYFWLVLVALFVSGALLVGMYPSFILSSFKPTSVLKGVLAKSVMGMSLRRVLVSFQFVLSIILIAGTLIVSKQLSFMRNVDLGYNKDQLLIIKPPTISDSTLAERYRYFRDEVSKIPVVNNIAVSSDIPGSIIRYKNSVRREGQDSKSNFTTSLVEVDDKYIPTYGIQLLAGRNFKPNEYIDFKTQTARVLINEVIVKALGFKDADDAVNKKIVFELGSEKITSEVIGVMKNFHNRSLREPYEPILCYAPIFSDWKYFSVNMRASDVQKNLSSIQRSFNASFPGNPFEYFFLDDHFNTQYQGDLRLGKVFGLFCILAVVVACLGLLGLTSFVIKLRTKEIGIRKVLGASIGSILILFSRDFVRMVLIASVIAIPVVYYAADKWLTNYAFHIDLTWLIFLVPVVILLVIALVTIGIQTMRAALTNPTISLRSE